jgi:dimethylhistidine N-methyltransferase
VQIEPQSEHAFTAGLSISKSAPLHFRSDVLAGLSARPKRLSSVYFYDDAGSALPEYYLTRVEHAILEAHVDQIIAPVLDEPCCVVDLGAGDGWKTRVLLERIHARGGDVRYAPVDVSAAALWSAQRNLRRQAPWLRVDPVHADYVAGLERVREAQVGRRLLVLWLGSSIGNFAHGEAAVLLRALAESCLSTDTLLIGFDRLKEAKRLVAAYDDAQGVTAQLNFNLLTRINRELGGDFELDGFEHHATFVPDRSRMESYLVSRRQQTVHVAGQPFDLDAWESIQTEISCKYSDAEIMQLLSAGGLAHVETFSDAEHTFADVICRPGLA